MKGYRMDDYIYARKDVTCNLNDSGDDAIGTADGILTDGAMTSVLTEMALDDREG
jgi:hypothetical protein